MVERGLGKSIRANEAVLDVGMLFIGSFEVQKQYVTQEDPHSRLAVARNARRLHEIFDIRNFVQKSYLMTSDNSNPFAPRISGLPFPVTKSQSPVNKSHVAMEKCSQSQLLFCPFMTLSFGTNLWSRINAKNKSRAR